MKLIKSLVAAATALVVGVPLSAHATATLEIFYDGILEKTCADESACDLTGAGIIGVIGTNFSMGAFSITLDSGITKPEYSAPDLMDISVQGSVKNTDSVAHTLTVLFSDTNFTTAGVVTGNYGNTNGLSAGTASAWYGDPNTLFDQTNLIGSTSPGVGTHGIFTGLVSSSPYSLTGGLTLTAAAGQTGSLSSDFHLTVPEPTSVALVGLSLLGLGIASRRRKAA